MLEITVDFKIWYCEFYKNQLFQSEFSRNFWYLHWDWISKNFNFKSVLVHQFGRCLHFFQMFLKIVPNSLVRRNAYRNKGKNSNCVPKHKSGHRSQKLQKEHRNRRFWQKTPETPEIGRLLINWPSFLPIPAQLSPKGQLSAGIGKRWGQLIVQLASLHIFR